MDDNFVTLVTDDGTIVTVGKDCPWREEALARLHPLPTDAAELRALLQPPWKDLTHQRSPAGRDGAEVKITKCPPGKARGASGRSGRWTGRDWRRMKAFK